jgi:hypothetical protein
MNDSASVQPFRINALHGNDAGVWVCEGSGLSLSPVLFMQALCPDSAPRPLLVKWKQSVPPPKPFRPSGTLPLVYSECGRIPPWPYHLHLFAPQEPVAGSVQRDCGLPDWSFTVRLIGIIIIFDQKHDGQSAVLALNRLINRSKPSKPNKPLAWVRAQQLPYVIAALGYDGTSEAKQQLRRRYEIAADIPIVPGPALADARRRRIKYQDDQTSMLPSVLGRKELAFDADHAKATLGALYQLIERKP